MKKTIITSLFTVSTLVALAFSIQSNGTVEDTSTKVPPCKKTILYCPNGLAYYKCSYTGTISSPDCWNVGSGCNITLRPC